MNRTTNGIIRHRFVNLSILSTALSALVMFCCLLTTDQCLGSEKVEQPSSARGRTEWYQDAKFGFEIHWGIYSVPGKGEWIMQNHKMTIQEYEKLAPQFNPVKYDPAQWVRLAKRAGTRYIIITSKHHDGFAMWDSQVSDWDVVDRTPYKKDVLKMLADECTKQDMPLLFYYSHLDWRHADYFPRGRTGQYSGRPDRGEFNRYMDYMNSQIAELCSGRYGRLGGICFDGWWDQQVRGSGISRTTTKTHVDWRLKETYDLIHRLQPQALIRNNHHVAPFPGEDLQVFEKDLPGHNKSGHSPQSVGTLPLETVDTINKSWGYNASDKAFKSTKELIHYLVRAAGCNANFSINVGPMPNGEIQPEAVKRLEEIGKWMVRNGETIYGTRGGPMPPQQWGVATQKQHKVYVHVLQAQPTEQLVLPEMAGVSIKSARLFKDGTDVVFNDHGGELVLSLPKGSIDPIDTIIVLETVSKP